MRAPILTKREFQIIEYLAAGITRDEIARDIKVSPETVKLHTKNILRKFDSASVRDGAADIQAFVRAYGKNGLGHQIFNTSVTVTAVIDPDKRRAQWEIKSQGYVVCGVVKDLTLATIKHNHLTNLLMNGVVPEIVTNSSSLAEYRVVLDCPLDQGKPIDRFTNFTELPPKEAAIQEISYMTGTPCSQLSLDVQFLGEEDITLGLKVFVGLKSQDFKNNPDISFLQNGNRAGLTVKNPSMETLYVVSMEP